MDNIVPTCTSYIIHGFSRDLPAGDRRDGTRIDRQRYEREFQATLLSCVVYRDIRLVKAQASPAIGWAMQLNLRHTSARGYISAQCVYL